MAARRHLTVPEFLRHIKAMMESEQHSRSTRRHLEGGVQLLSIYRAKGLEFDSVFLEDLVEGALPHEYALEEERRLLYVAITRARRRLAIGVPLERFGRKTRPSRFIAELGRTVSAYPAERPDDPYAPAPPAEKPAEAHPTSRRT